MKNFRFPILALVLIMFYSGCEEKKADDGAKSIDNSSLSEDSAPEKEKGEDVDVPQSRKLCFLERTVGDPIIANGDTYPMVDTMSIRLEITGDNVKGYYNWQPAEKDRFQGKLEGRIEGEIITAIFHWNGEGQSGLEEKVFKLEADKIWIMDGEGDEIDGVYKLIDKEFAEYVESVPKVDCW